MLAMVRRRPAAWLQRRGRTTALTRKQPAVLTCAVRLTHASRTSIMHANADGAECKDSGTNDAADAADPMHHAAAAAGDARAFKSLVVRALKVLFGQVPAAARIVVRRRRRRRRRC